jgi:hypothetical protein
MEQTTEKPEKRTHRPDCNPTQRPKATAAIREGLRKQGIEFSKSSELSPLFSLVYVCASAGCGTDMSKAKSPIHGLRFHDVRHHAMTEVAESQASELTIMSIAGHVLKKMLERYSHIRVAARRTALGALSMGRGGYDTKLTQTGRGGRNRKRK